MRDIDTIVADMLDEQSAGEGVPIRVRGHHGRSFTTGDTVTVEGSPGVWRIAGFFGPRNRIADLVRVDRKWTAATSAYVRLLRAVA